MTPSSSVFQLLLIALPLVFAIPITDLTTASNQAAEGNQTTTMNQTTTAVVCPPGSQYSCNATCVEYCENINDVYLNCTNVCRCSCAEGYVFKSNASLVCVPIPTCQAKCLDNMHHNECAPDSPERCDKPLVDGDPDLGCNPMCVCDEGFVLSSLEPRICVSRGECFGKSD